ncbi:MAG: arsenate reductase (glutaredoxin) [Pseudomonadaceae bacterium]|nr:arsenate reductase (glutaredoxin) [Pseudomonadaceae bacterium]
MSDVTLYHNPRCSKSRATLALLEEQGISAEVVEYLEQPLSADELREVARMLGGRLIDMTRTKETIFKELGLAEADEDTLAQAMAAHPILMERPIVCHQDQAEIGRPPEAVLALFD